MKVTAEELLWLSRCIDDSERWQNEKTWPGDWRQVDGARAVLRRLEAAAGLSDAFNQQVRETAKAAAKMGDLPSMAR